MRHPFHKKRESISLLLRGRTPEEISTIIGVNKNTIIAWRNEERRLNGTIFPSHRGSRKGMKFSIEKTYFKYTDDEILQLVRQNPGFGLNRFIKILYSTNDDESIRYRITMLLIDYKEESGEDLYSLLQDTSFDQFVSYRNYVRITGKRPKRPGSTSSRFGSNQSKFRVPPQNFNWDKITPASDRPPRKT